ncbi:hypothetical protein ACJIZ3_023242 [Penstemon smallii]|uniref:Uncharacterized protein n=1 Tax=Penstemon smallii TaxID=265156 RepID=A0ABD3TPX5_9LAMI
MKRNNIGEGAFPLVNGTREIFSVEIIMDLMCGFILLLLGCDQVSVTQLLNGCRDNEMPCKEGSS